MIELTGSLILSTALFMARLSVPQAAWLTRLETEFQVTMPHKLSAFIIIIIIIIIL